MNISKCIGFFCNLTYDISLSIMVAFCYLPFIREDYPWWSRPLAVAAATAFVWVGRTTPRKLK